MFVLYNLHRLCKLCSPQTLARILHWGMKTLQIDHLKEFVALATTLSFSETAQKLYIPQSTLSRHIASIEEEIAAKLLVRDTHHVRLTKIGRAFLNDAQNVIQSYDNALDNVKRLKAEQKQILRIGYLYDAARKYLPQITSALNPADSNVLPQYQTLEYGDLMYHLLVGKIDIAISMDIDNVASSATMEKIYLGEDWYCAAVPKNHPLASRDSINLFELTGENIIFPDPEAMGLMNHFFSKAAKADELGIEPAFYYKDIPSLIFQIEQGVGVSLVFTHHKKRYSDNVSFVDIEDINLTCKIALFIPQKAKMLVEGDWAQSLKSLDRSLQRKRFPVSSR